MTHVELQHRLPKDAPQRDRVLTTLHYHAAYADTPSMTTREIREAMVKAKVPNAKKMNVSAVLSALAPFVDRLDETRNGGHLHTLTTTGTEYLRDNLGLLAPPKSGSTEPPAAAADAAVLETLAASVSDNDVRDYLDEAVRCLRAGARRAAVVFVWTGAVATLRANVWQKGAPAIEASLQRHRPKASFAKEGDFAYVNDDTLLQIAQDLGVIDKSEKGHLKQQLDLRNDCGHPVKYKPGEKKVSAFIEDVVGIVWK